MIESTFNLLALFRIFQVLYLATKGMKNQVCEMTFEGLVPVFRARSEAGENYRLSAGNRTSPASPDPSYALPLGVKEVYALLRKAVARKAKGAVVAVLEHRLSSTGDVVALTVKTSYDSETEELTPFPGAILHDPLKCNYRWIVRQDPGSQGTEERLFVLARPSLQGAWLPLANVALSEDDRPGLSNVCLRASERGEAFAATEGHMYVEVKRNFDASVEAAATPAPVEVLIPGRVLQLLDAKGEVNVWAGGPTTRLEVDGDACSEPSLSVNWIARDRGHFPNLSNQMEYKLDPKSTEVTFNLVAVQKLLTGYAKRIRTKEWVPSAYFRAHAADRKELFLESTRAVEGEAQLLDIPREILEVLNLRKKDNDTHGCLDLTYFLTVLEVFAEAYRHLSEFDVKNAHVRMTFGKDCYQVSTLTSTAGNLSLKAHLAGFNGGHY